MSEPPSPPHAAIDRTPGRLVVISFINLYLGFGCTVVGLGFENSGGGKALLTLGGLFNMSCLPLIIIAIVMRLTAPEQPQARSSHH